MNHQQEENERKHKRKGLWYAWFFGGVVLGIAMLPFMRSEPPDPPPPIVEIRFADFEPPPREAGASKSKASKSREVSEEPKPPKMKPVEQLDPPPEPDPLPVPERPTPKPVITTPEPNPPIVTAPEPVEEPKPEPKPVEKPRPKPPVRKPTPKPRPRPTPPAPPRADPEPVVVESGEPSDRNEAGSAREASDREESGSVDGTSDSGTSGGGGVTEGSGEGGDSGDGVLKRKPVYRVDVKKLGGKNGRITANICIDRKGNVISVEENEAKTTMKDRELVEKAINILKRYRFERDSSAKEKECGTYAFIFSAEQ